eukprot:6114731-Amphidinium_carterae.1
MSRWICRTHTASHIPLVNFHTLPDAMLECVGDAEDKAAHYFAQIVSGVEWTSAEQFRKNGQKQRAVSGGGVYSGFAGTNRFTDRAVLQCGSDSQCFLDSALFTL